MAPVIVLMMYLYQEREWQKCTVGYQGKNGQLLCVGGLLRVGATKTWEQFSELT